MATYVYENGQGERREILASMKAPPPEMIAIWPDGSWTPRTMGAFAERWLADGEGGGLTGFRKERSDWWVRLYGEGMLKGIVSEGEGVHHNGQKLPVSMSLPDDNRAGVPDRLYGHEVRRHDDGTFSTVDRRPICHNADAMKKHTERIGWTHERG